MKQPITISHDAFARFETVREVATNIANTDTRMPTILATCDWCGQHRPGTAIHLFRYGTVPDARLSGVIDWSPGLFCSVDCYRTYNA